MISLALLLLRLVIGLTLAAHGAQKMFGWFGGPGLPGFQAMLERQRVRPAQHWAWIGAIGELVGGLLVALGLLNPVGPALAAGAMLTAIFLVHLPNGFFNTKGGFEFPFVIPAALVAIGLAGPGAYSLDALIGFSLPQPAATVIALVLALLGALAAAASRPASRHELV
ncbi:MAG TPA: DoxX family protein [Candidatus Dormibacteraeota bacterium]